MKKTPLPALCVIIACMAIMHLPTSADARKWSFTTRSRSTNPTVIASFLTDNQNAASARPISNRVYFDDKVYFYYKVGPLQSISGKGAPFQTRLVVQQNGRTLKDFGWQSANAASESQMRKNMNLTWYHSARWNLSISPRMTGNYTAIVDHRDMNSGKTLTMRYNFTVAGGRGGG